MFGVTYGLSVVGLYSLLGRLGVPTFYDKLLQVPIMNLLVRLYDRIAVSGALAWCNPARVAQSARPMRRNFVYTALWVAVFSTMTIAGGLGDVHPGHHVPFWMNACRDGKRDGCAVLEQIETRYCGLGSGWACNDLGVLMTEGKLKDNTHAVQAFDRACRLGFAPGCENQQRATGEPPRRADPQLADYPFLLREGKGALPFLTRGEIFQRACQQGWTAACGAQ